MYVVQFVRCTSWKDTLHTAEPTMVHNRKQRHVRNTLGAVGVLHQSGQYWVAAAWYSGCAAGSECQKCPRGSGIQPAVPATVFNSKVKDLRQEGRTEFAQNEGFNHLSQKGSAVCLEGRVYFGSERKEAARYRGGKRLHFLNFQMWRNGCTNVKPELINLTAQHC